MECGRVKGHARAVTARVGVRTRMLRPTQQVQAREDRSGLATTDRDIADMQPSTSPHTCLGPNLHPARAPALHPNLNPRPDRGQNQ
eukprot:3901814-Pleurochrysis_carterae.AAC.1